MMGKASEEDITMPVQFEYTNQKMLKNGGPNGTVMCYDEVSGDSRVFFSCFFLIKCCVYQIYNLKKSQITFVQVSFMIL